MSNRRFLTGGLRELPVVQFKIDKQWSEQDHTTHFDNDPEGYWGLPALPERSGDWPSFCLGCITGVGFCVMVLVAWRAWR